MNLRFTPATLLASLVAFVALAVSALAAPAAFAEANAVLPTSAAPGVSTTEINSYVEVPFPRNDDGTWPCGGGGHAPPACPGPEGQLGPTAFPLGFDINFFGTKYSASYINNNGNITFTGPLSTFTPESLTTFGSPIIAPYFADVDTRGAASATVNFGQGTLDGKKVFVVNWPKVGCFNEVSSVLNNFQLVLIDRPDLGTGPNGDDFDMEFNYNSIQWDTGEASGGNFVCLKESPFGTSAIAGYTNGSTNHFQLSGSEEPNAFLDSTESSGLIYHDLNSFPTLGRYLFTVENGEPPAETQTSTSLEGGGKSGGSIAVPEGTPVKDTATLSGEKASTAGGTATYSVYSDEECTSLVTTAGTVSVTNGNVPPSNEVTLPPGTYYWQASYSGDEHNNPSKNACGSEVLTVERAVTCSKIIGSGHWGARNSTGGNLNNKLSTTLTEKQELGTTTPNGEFVIRLTKLTEAKCVGKSGAGEFSGTGTAKVNGAKGYVVHFAFNQEGGSTYYTLIVEKESIVVYSLIHQKLNRASTEHLS